MTYKYQDRTLGWKGWTPMESTASTSPVVGFAELAILTLRVNGVSDNDILDFYTQPDPRADARMEARQLQESGTIFAPALDVKLAMRRLLLAVAA